MLALRKTATILIGLAIGTAETESGGVGAALAQPQPDLTVSMNAVPNPVPIGMGYEVQVRVSNPQPPSIVISPEVPRVPVLPPGVAVPDALRSATPEGADVQQAELLLGSTVTGGRVAMQTTPPLSISGCYALGPGSPNERCIIGPLNKGGNWTITLVYMSPVPPGHTFPYTIGYWATIDDRNKIAERNEGNNTASVTVSFQGTVTCAPTTRCDRDPATTDPRCQICYRDNCDGTGSLWHTC
jgi:hypothetical protein